MRESLQVAAKLRLEPPIDLRSSDITDLMREETLRVKLEGVPREET